MISCNQGLDYEIHLPNILCHQVYPDHDYLEYFLKWLRLNGCLVLQGNTSTLSVFQLKPRIKVDNPEDYLLAFEVMFRADVSGNCSSATSKKALVNAH